MIVFYFEKKKQQELFTECRDMFTTGHIATEMRKIDSFGLRVGLPSQSTAASHSMGNRDKHKLLSHRNIRARPIV
jgi:hypothetical protein